MKKLTTTLFAQLGTVRIQTLTTVVKETLAVDCKTSTPVIFTVAELSNIQSRKKSVGGRRFMF